MISEAGDARKTAADTIPGWAGHFDGKSAKGIHEKAAWLSLRNGLALVEASFVHALDEVVERLREHLCTRGGVGENDTHES